MPVLKIICRENKTWTNQTGVPKYHDDSALEDVISYCIQPNKTPHGFVGGFGVNLNQPAFEMERLAKAYGKKSGLRLRHMILSFSREETKRFRKRALDNLKKIADYAAQYYGIEYQIIYAIHEDTDHYHIHFVMNTVSFRNGAKYRGDKGDYYHFQEYLRIFLREYYGLPLRVCSDGEEAE